MTLPKKKENILETQDFSKPQMRLSNFINRELSWLDFNRRVLDEGLQPDTPLLERLRFLTITSSNLDEFFMVRVAGMRKIYQEGLVSSDSPDQSPADETLLRIRSKTQDLMKLQFDCLKKEVLPALKSKGVHILKYSQLDKNQKERADEIFRHEIFPVLTPLAVDPSHPFPFLTNDALYLAVTFTEKKHEKQRGKEERTELSQPKKVGFVQIPSLLPRLVRVDEEKFKFILLEDLIHEHLDSLFLGFRANGSYPFRILRNLDYNFLENEVVDLLKSVQKKMVAREQQEAVRLELADDFPSDIAEILKSELELTSADVYILERPVCLAGFSQLCQLPLEHLKFPPFNPRLPRFMDRSENLFTLLETKDLLVHHPFESFYAVTEFLNTAAYDPDVLAIKQTLYRTSGDSPIISSLIAAAENGKQVTAVVELKARFDEKNNVVWARRLERAGVNVVFGFVGLKTHAKAILVVRKKGTQIIRYAHVSTGNYNSMTAKLYTDLGFFTSNEKFCDDISYLFNLLTGFNIFDKSVDAGGRGAYPRKLDAVYENFSKLDVAPRSLRSSIISMIDDEIQSHSREGGGFILAKINALVDKAIIEKLYEASQAGVSVRLIVRGVCSLRPGVKGLSENISVISIVDRFLEHSRLLIRRNGGNYVIKISSADLMPRNMDRRIEIMFALEDEEIRRRVLHEVFTTYWCDSVKAWELLSDGSYKRRVKSPASEFLPDLPKDLSEKCDPKVFQKIFRAQERLIELVRAGGVKSIPYEKAIRHNPLRKETAGKLGKKMKRPRFEGGKR